MLTVMNAWKPGMLDVLLSGFVTGHELRLFQNDFTPTAFSGFGDFTEADFSGYSAINLPSWGASSLNGSNQGQADHPAVTFTAAGIGVGNTIYGWFYENGAGGVFFAERFPGGPITITSDGDTITIAPRLLLDRLS